MLYVSDAEQIIYHWSFTRPIDRTIIEYERLMGPQKYIVVRDDKRGGYVISVVASTPPGEAQ